MHDDVEINLDQTELFFDKLTEIIDYPLYEESPRTTLSATLAVSSLQYGAAVRVLSTGGLLLGAGTTLRSQFEALVRSVWILYCASNSKVERLTVNLTKETQQTSKNIPLANEMLSDLHSVPNVQNLLVSLKEFKDSSWLPLNSFVHSGLHAVHWTKHRPPQKLLEQCFRISNGLALLAFQCLGILTGRSSIQAEVTAVADEFKNCLPEYRKYT